MLDHPVGSALGDKQRTPSDPCADAADTVLALDEPKRHCIASDISDIREPTIVSTVPPSVGPDHGVMSRTTRDTCSTNGWPRRWSNHADMQLPVQEEGAGTA